MSIKLPPKLLDFSPDYRAAFDRYNEIARTIASEQTKAEALERRIQAARGVPAADRVDVAARTFLGQTVERDESVAALRLALGQVNEQVEILRRALSLQWQEVLRMRGESSVQLCRSIRAEYEALARRLAEAFVALHAAACDEAAYRDALDKTEAIYSGLLPVFTLTGVLDSPIDPSSRWQSVLKEAQELGLLEGDRKTRPAAARAAAA